MFWTVFKYLVLAPDTALKPLTRVNKTKGHYCPAIWYIIVITVKVYKNGKKQTKKAQTITIMEEICF